MKKYFITPELDEFSGAIWEVRMRLFFGLSWGITKYSSKTLAAKLSIRLNREYERSI